MCTDSHRLSSDVKWEVKYSVKASKNTKDTPCTFPHYNVGHINSSQLHLKGLDGASTIANW